MKAKDTLFLVLYIKNVEIAMKVAVVKSADEWLHMLLSI